MDKLIVGADYVKQLWVPDTFFVNEKVASFHQATQVFFITCGRCVIEKIKTNSFLSSAEREIYLCATDEQIDIVI